MSIDILDRLKAWAGGDRDLDPSQWGTQMRVDLNDAIREIERLRSISGATSDGMSLADIKRELGQRSF